jgi:hypothetical protein
MTRGSSSSRKVLLTLMGAAALGMSTPACNRPRHRSVTPGAAEAALPLRDYRMDEFFSGAGYYHAPVGAFYPYRWNHRGTQGYFHGGSWSPTPQQASVMSSQPSMSALMAARQAYLQYLQPSQSGSSGGSPRFGSSSYRSWGSSTSSPRPSTRPSSSPSSNGSTGSTTRYGGFGGSGSRFSSGS